ncbi:MAG: carboxypeptidase regulatory-like domain-containing protein, partial [Pirellulales bacterium]|nr:carboxypeptidase regulatory-like domain-containing protein [Pirellulales bacterium]
MKTSLPLTRVVLVLTCLGLLLQPLPLVAAERPSPPVPRLGDVQLGARGTLHGTVLNPQGIAVPSARVIVMKGADRVADTATDEHGRFVVSKLQPGVHLVAAVGSAKTYRFWTP